MKKVVALILLCICVLGLAGCESSSQRETLLLETGPWADEAIWVDEDSEIYLVCTKSGDDPYAEVTAFLVTDGQWQSFELHLKQGTSIVVFNTPTTTILQARAQMNDGKLRLYNFETDDEDATQRYVDVELSKFSYSEKIDTLPFEVNNQF